MTTYSAIQHHLRHPSSSHRDRSSQIRIPTDLSPITIHLDAALRPPPFLACTTSLPVIHTHSSAFPTHHHCIVFLNHPEFITYPQSMPNTVSPQAKYDSKNDRIEGFSIRDVWGLVRISESSWEKEAQEE